MELSPMVRVGKIKCKTLMGKSKIEGVDYAINPYLGCQHGCLYCYARFMGRRGHSGEEWGTFVDVKINALNRLAKELPRKKLGVVLLSSVTDPYQPLERKWRLTRGSLKLLLDYDFPTNIQTKSTLVLRDLDLLQRFSDCKVGFTITTTDDDVRKIFEPSASPVEERLEALRVLKEEGVQTYAFLGPMLPYLSEGGLGKLLDELADSVDRVIVDRLNIKWGNLVTIRRALSKHYPDLQPMFESALSPESGYYERLKEDMAAMFHARGIPFDLCY